MKIKNTYLILFANHLFNGCAQLQPTPAITFIDLYILNKTVTHIVEVRGDLSKGQFYFNK